MMLKQKALELTSSSLETESTGRCSYWSCLRAAGGSRPASASHQRSHNTDGSLWQRTNRSPGLPLRFHQVSTPISRFRLGLVS